MQESCTEKDEMRQQNRMNTMVEMTGKIKAKSRMYAQNSWWVSDLLAAAKECGFTQNWMILCRWYNWLQDKKKQEEENGHEDEDKRLVSRMIARAAVPAALLLPRGYVVTLYSANKEIGSTDESYPPTHSWKWYEWCKYNTS